MTNQAQELTPQEELANLYANLAPFNQAIMRIMAMTMSRGVCANSPFIKYVHDNIKPLPSLAKRGRDLSQERQIEIDEFGKDIADPDEAREWVLAFTYATLAEDAIAYDHLTELRRIRIVHQSTPAPIAATQKEA